MTRKTPVNRPDLKRHASTELPVFRDGATMPAGASNPGEESPVESDDVKPSRVESAAREVLTKLDRVGWPIVMNQCVAELRAALDAAAGDRLAARYSRSGTP